MLSCLLGVSSPTHATPVLTLFLSDIKNNNLMFLSVKSLISKVKKNFLTQEKLYGFSLK